MIDFREVYRRAEDHTKILVVGLFVCLGMLIILQSIFSPVIVAAGLFVVAALFTAVYKPTWILGSLALYLPFETIVLKFTPEEVYIFARYFPETLIYVIASVILWKFFSGKLKHRPTVIDLPFVLFILSLLASALINFVPASIAVLGIRQIIRFMIVFFLVVHLRPKKAFIETLTYLMFAVLLIQSVIGITQSFVGAPLDSLLLSSQERTLGAITLTAGTQQFWDPGSRVFSTLGRYDRLGNFLYIFLLIGSGFLFMKKKSEKIQKILPWIFILGVPTLVLTFSRASWFAFILGFLFIGIYIMRDKRVVLGFGAFVIAIMLVLGASGLNVSLLAEGSGQTLTERFFESFSYTRWRGEYFGLGRTFWFVHTPLNVVAASPVFGWGPGQFGGGVAAALHNTTAYEAVDLPFGVFGTEGFIDNNWFSLWGESGTLGMVFYLWLYTALFVYALKLYRSSNDAFTKSIALGYCALMVAVAFNAFTSTLLEIRTVAFYLWLYGGFVVVLGQQREKKNI